LNKFTAKRVAKIKNGGADLDCTFSPCSEYRVLKFYHRTF